MRLYCREFFGEADSSFVVDEATSTITLIIPDSGYKGAEENRVEYKLEIPASGYWAYFFDQTGKVVRLDSTDVMMSATSPSYLTKLYIAHPSKSLIAVSFDDIVILRAKVKGEGLKYFSSKDYPTNLDFLASISDSAAAVQKKYAARQESVFAIDSQSSLAALERQVDYLTQVIAKLVPKDTTLADFLAQTSLYNDEMIPKSLAFKTKLREIQHQYDERK